MRKSKVRYWTLFCPKYWAFAAAGAESAAAAATATASRADLLTKRDIGAPSTPTGCGLADTGLVPGLSGRSGRAPAWPCSPAQRLATGGSDGADPRHFAHLRGLGTSSPD